MEKEFANIITTNDSGSGSVSPSKCIINLSMLYNDIKELSALEKEYSTIKLGEISIINGLLECLFQECTNLSHFAHRHEEQLKLQRELVRNIKKEMLQEKNN